MKQLTQKLIDGRIQVIEVPVPVVSKGMVLVQNVYSVISTGTEGSKVKAARKNILGKARERPQQARQMVELLRQAGPVQAYRTAMKKLDSYSPLGYSSAGLVIGLGDGVSGFSIGDKVACAGASASHSEIVSVPQNLCVALEGDADLSLATYNTLGAIALQGVRQADLRLGESCAVIGLGLLGQLTCLLLKASGNKVVGIDINSEVVQLANAHATSFAALRDEIGLVERITELTGGIGLDAVIITAASQSTDPINFSGRILKRKGRVVIVGSVPTGFNREPFYYPKELDLRMSCSYGPGRYDPIYEEKGIDYPPEYVRWTERRNMGIFQELVHSNAVDISYLTTHTFSLDDAPKAYELVTDNGEFHLGIVIKYGQLPAIPARVAIKERPSVSTERVAIAFVGAGSYAMSHLLPNLPKEDWIKRTAVMTASGLSSRTVAERFDFDYCTSDESQIFQNNSINTVFIATRHDTHAEYVIKGLNSGKSIFVEKPLCITEAELSSIATAASERKDPAGILFVGFNRRFSPLTTIIREKIGIGPMAMIYRINAGALAAGSWIRDSQVGGGRIIGEVCHFIDLLTFLNGSLPEKVQAFGLSEQFQDFETVNINVKFANGSIGEISYFANGPKGLPKEYLEIYKGGAVAILRDFKEVKIVTSNASTSKKLLFQDKGQTAMVKAFLEAVRTGGPAPIPFEEIVAVTRATLQVVESLSSSSIISV